jgi:hypothetical protein
MAAETSRRVVGVWCSNDARKSASNLLLDLFRWKNRILFLSLCFARSKSLSREHKTPLILVYMLQHVNNNNNKT